MLAQVAIFIKSNKLLSKNSHSLKYTSLEFINVIISLEHSLIVDLLKLKLLIFLNITPSVPDPNNTELLIFIFLVLLY
jgi:hypothetical protein